MDFREVYFSSDIEADGPIPGPYSMLSFGVSAHLASDEVIGRFAVNLIELPGATQDPDTMEWWSKHPEQWEACRKDPEAPETALARFVDWVDRIPGKPVFVARPLGYDFMFLYWYMIHFAKRSPFEYRGLDIKSYAMGALGTGYYETASKMPAAWNGSGELSHIGVEDAEVQGNGFIAMLRDRQNQVR